MQTDNITYAYARDDGIFTINVTASNSLSSESAQTTINVQRRVKKDDYVMNSDSPQIHPCYPCLTSGKSKGCQTIRAVYRRLRGRFTTQRTARNRRRPAGNWRLSFEAAPY